MTSAASAIHTETRLRAAAFLLALVAVALFLPGYFRLQPMDRDEPRFAQASKQMLETGDYVSIRFQDTERNKKPVGIYWAQAAVVGTAEALGFPQARETIWLYRIPSFLGALATVMLTYWTGLAFGSRRTALLAGLLLASTVVLGVEARLAKTDAVTAATVVACMSVLARLWHDRAKNAEGSWRGLALPAVFWTAMAAGVLVKGPITPMVVALAALTLSVYARSGRWLVPLRPLAGLLWFLLLVSPWFVLIMLRTNGGFLSDAVGADMMQKVAGNVEAHGAPPGTYLAVFLGTAWPMAPFAVLAAPFAWFKRRDPTVVFLLAWLVPSWLLFEAVPTKLPHYVLPLFPAIALLVGHAAGQGALTLDSRWRKAVASLVPALAVVLLIAGAVACYRVGVAPGWPFLLAVPVVAYLALRFVRMFDAPPLTLAMSSAAMALLVYIAIYGGLLTGPFAQPFAVAPRMAAAIEQARVGTRCPYLTPTTAGFAEPSFVFLTRTDAFLTIGSGAADFIAAAPCRVALVERRYEPEFGDRLGPRADVRLVGRLQGMNFNKRTSDDYGIYVRGSGT